MTPLSPSSVLRQPLLKKPADTPVKPLTDAVANPDNPRSIPRAAVWIGAAGIVGVFAMKRTSQASDNRKVIQDSPVPQASELSKTVSDHMPIVMNAGKYQTLRKKGLGVHED